MKAVILTITFAAVLQLVSGSLFAGYMVDKLGVIAQQQTESLKMYVDDKDVSTRLYIDQRDRDLYNAMQVQISDERTSMKAYVEKIVALRLSQQEKK
ncbi:hypothetical protein [Pseudomonas atacamensis]|jgi:hypothetical protein|uniref:hypothetical protein n=1 Tax=Pseudomonas atacamensis TaxID=2565368 RepID=UPI00247FE523|nr:hypothetical protein [Pseudomonas atacamensis]WGT32983.1 hypothetical protein QG303_21835 [Pseudomonas atacamensis]